MEVEFIRDACAPKIIQDEKIYMAKFEFVFPELAFTQVYTQREILPNSNITLMLLEIRRRYEYVVDIGEKEIKIP